MVVVDCCRRHINRENARKSRQRKKEREIFLQSENEKLAMENERLLQALLIFIRSASGEQLEQWGLPIDSDVPITTDTIRYWVSNCNIAAISKVATNQPNLGLNTIHNPVHSTAISSEAMAFERSEDTTSTDHQSLRSSSSGGSSSFSSETQPFQSVSYTQLPQSKTSSTPEVTVSDEHYQVRLTDGSLPQRMLSLESHLPSWGGEQQHISDVHFTAQASFPSLFSEESLPAPATSSWRSELPSASASIHEEGQGGGT